MAVREEWRVKEDAVVGMTRGTSEDGWDEWSDDPPPEGSYTWRQVEAIKAAKATVQDGSDYRAELRTSPDFFCALFEAKP